MPKIAVLDNDKEWRDLLFNLLSGFGYSVLHYSTPGRFLDHMATDKPDLLILDMQLPGMHGREIIRILRSNSETRRMLIVAISGNDVTSPDAIKAFEAGADEYLAKPLDIPLLRVRLEALLRRGTDGRNLAVDEICVGKLRVDPESHSVLLGKQSIRLTNLQFELLLAFVKQPNRVLTRGIILETVWKTRPDMNTRTVDKHVESLRRELGDFGKRIETVIGVGYVFRRED
jgi:DNA-binding response OmpR family regulator